VQFVPGARLAPDSETEDEPAAAVAVPVQVVVRPFGVATTSPAGRVSVKEIAFSVWFWLLLEMVKVRLVVPFSGIVAAPNAFAIVGGLITSRSALEVEFAPVPANVELMVTLLW